MKRTLSLIFCLVILTITNNIFAKNPQNLYEQLCEVNQEWLKYKKIAKNLGYLSMPKIENEQDLLVFHIQTLEKIFTEKNTNDLSKSQLIQRKKHLEVLNEYWKRRNCPKNYYLPYRNPVFIDHEGRYCAVAYLMLKSGKEKFCKDVQKNNNFIYIRAIQNDEFSNWQKQSGLSIDELAWIQPGYDPYTRFAYYDKLDAKGNPVYLPQKQSKMYYNEEKDQSQIMSVIFFMNNIDIEKQIKKLNYKGKQPDWEKLVQKNRITSIGVFKDEIYVGCDSTYYSYVGDSTITTEKSAIMKYNKNNEWETILDLKGKDRVYKLKSFNGNLLAYGGSHIYNRTTQKVEYHSFLGQYDGKNWNIDSKDYKSIIFIVLASKGKINYIGTTVNRMDFYTEFYNEDGTPKNK
ncbi:MAG: hypothetical protein EAZ20_03285 [Bacteroidetes bacterium]|nr:MAG: hypothetical protein EAZ20_03285 [Bacteroidota bacterium]